MSKTLKLILAVGIYTGAVCTFSSCGTPEDTDNSVKAELAPDTAQVMGDPISQDIEDYDHFDTIPGNEFNLVNIDTTVITSNGDTMRVVMTFDSEIQIAEQWPDAIKSVVPRAELTITNAKDSIVFHSPINLDRWKDTIFKHEILAEGTEVEMGAEFFKKHVFDSVDIEVDDFAISMNYTYPACQNYDCGILFQNIFWFYNMKLEQRVSDYNKSPML